MSRRNPALFFVTELGVAPQTLYLKSTEGNYEARYEIGPPEQLSHP